MNASDPSARSATPDTSNTEAALSIVCREHIVDLYRELREVRSIREDILGVRTEPAYEIDHGGIVARLATVIDRITRRLLALIPPGVEVSAFDGWRVSNGRWRLIERHEDIPF